MSFRTKFWLLCGVAAFLSLTLAGGLVYQTMARAPQESHDFLPASLEAAGLDRLVIKRAGASIELGQSGGVWTVATGGDRLPVRASRVDDALKSLKAMRSLRVASAGAQGYAALMIDDAQAVQVDMVSKGQTRSLWFGGLSEDGTEQYVRESAGGPVYAVKSGVAYWFQQDPAYWHDKRVWPVGLKPEGVLGVQFQSPKGGSTKLMKQSQNGAETWATEGAGAARVKKDRVSAWLQTLVDGEADGLTVLAAGKLPGGLKEAGILTLETKDNRSLAVGIYEPASKDDKWLVVPRYEGKPLSANGQTLAFEVPQWKIDLEVLGG